MEFPQLSPAPLYKEPERLRPDPGTRGFTVDLSAVAAAQEATKINAEGFVKQAGAGAYIGKALQDAGHEMGKLAVEQFKSINRRKGEEAQIMLTAARKHIAQLQSEEPDETRWSEIFEREASKWSDTLLKDKSLSPVAREDIEAQISAFLITGRSGTVQASARRSFQREHDVLEGGRRQALQSGDGTLADQFAHKLAANGHASIAARDSMLAQNADAVERHGRKARADARGRDQQSFAEMVKLNPWAAQEALEAKQFHFFDEDDRKVAVTTVKNAISLWQENGFQEIQRSIAIDDSDASADGILWRCQELKLDDDTTKELTSFRGSLMNARAADKPVDELEAAQLQADIRAYDPEKYTYTSDALKDYNALVRRAELAGAGGGEAAKKTKAVWNDMLAHKHPFLEHQPTAEEIAAKGTLEKALDIYGDSGSFGPKTRTMRIIGPPKENGEPGEDIVKEVPDPDTARRRIHASQRLSPLYRTAWKNGEVDPNDIYSVSDWLSQKIKLPVQAEQVKHQLGGSPVPGGARAAEENLKAIIKR